MSFRWCWRLGLAAVVALAVAPSLVRADEVDDILGLKVRNRDRVQRFSGEFTAEIDQPRTLKNPKTLRMRYRVKIEKMPLAARKHAHAMWRMETEVLEPIPMALRVEGEQAWYLDQHGTWIEIPLTAELREQFTDMSERFLGADVAEQRKRFSIKVVRRRNPIFGPKIVTLEYQPRGRTHLFGRMEEDVSSDGLPLETRLYDDTGAETVRVKVKKHHKVKGVPIVDEVESVGRGPAGETTSRTRCEQVSIEVSE